MYHELSPKIAHTRPCTWNIIFQKRMVCKCVRTKPGLVVQIPHAHYKRHVWTHVQPHNGGTSAHVFVHKCTPPTPPQQLSVPLQPKSCSQQLENTKKLALIICWILFSTNTVGKLLRGRIIEFTCGRAHRRAPVWWCWHAGFSYVRAHARQTCDTTQLLLLLLEKKKTTWRCCARARHAAVRMLSMFVATRMLHGFNLASHDDDDDDDTATQHTFWRPGTLHTQGHKYTYQTADVDVASAVAVARSTRLPAPLGCQECVLFILNVRSCARVRVSLASSWTMEQGQHQQHQQQ